MFAQEKSTFNEGGTSTYPLVWKWVVPGIERERDLSGKASSPLGSKGDAPRCKSTYAAGLVLILELDNVAWSKMLQEYPDKVINAWFVVMVKEVHFDAAPAGDIIISK
jgi:hypothetical protein